MKLFSKNRSLQYGSIETLWQRQKDGSLKPTIFSKKLWNDTKEQYATAKIEWIPVVWIAEWKSCFRYRKPIKKLKYRQSKPPLAWKNRAFETYTPCLTCQLDQLSYLDVNVPNLLLKWNEFDRLLEPTSVHKSICRERVRWSVCNSALIQFCDWSKTNIKLTVS